MSQTIEQELNELRSLIAQSASAGASPKTVKALEARLAALEERVVAVSDPGAAARDQILSALARAKGGKPGYLSMAAIGEQCKMTKSAVHTHVNVLEKAGKVWIRKTHDPENGRPCFIVYDPRALGA
jgi:DNA-binding transcriptional ArsR family regulator